MDHLKHHKDIHELIILTFQFIDVDLGPMTKKKRVSETKREETLTKRFDKKFRDLIDLFKLVYLNPFSLVVIKQCIVRDPLLPS